MLLIFYAEFTESVLGTLSYLESVSRRKFFNFQSLGGVLRPCIQSQQIDARGNYERIFKAILVTLSE